VTTPERRAEALTAARAVAELQQRKGPGDRAVAAAKDAFLAFDFRRSRELTAP
jgi:hypothetical protein